MGASSQSLPDSELPAPPWATQTRYFTVKLPVNGGQTFNHTVDGKPMVLTAPANKKEGDKHEFTYVDRRLLVEQMHFSTLPQAPVGMKIVKQLPLIFLLGPSVRGEKAGQANMNDLQVKALEKAASLGCNALLGVQLTISREYRGVRDFEGSKPDQMCINTAITATPCIVMPDAPAYVAGIVVQAAEPPPYSKAA